MDELAETVLTISQRESLMLAVDRIDIAHEKIAEAMRLASGIGVDAAVFSQLQFCQFNLSSARRAINFFGGLNESVPVDPLFCFRSDSQLAAIELMRAAGQEVRDTPGEPSAETRLLRANLTFEEAMETINALGFSIRFEGPVASIPPQIFFVDDRPFRLIDAIDGCCDSNVINAGTLAALGVPDRPVQREVERSNRSKLLDDGTLPPHESVDGKFGKGPYYSPPDLESVLLKLP
jgi:hypothetical protein